MANVKISELSSAAALTGSEEVAIVQSNATVKTTAQAIADLAGGGGFGTLDIVTTGTLGENNNVNYMIGAAYSGSATGAQSYPVVAIPDINFYGSPSNTLTAISFPTVTATSFASLNNFGGLQTVEFPELLTTSAVNLQSCPALTTVSFPKLTSVGQNGLQLGSSVPFTMTTFSFPALTSCYKLQCFQNYLGLTAITSVQFPVLAQLGLSFQNVSDLTEITLPSVTSTSLFGFSCTLYNGTLTKVHLVNLETINTYSMSFNSNYGLSDVQIGTVGVTKTFNGNGNNPMIDFQGCALSQASVDGILALWASLDGTNGTSNVNSGNMYLQGGANSTPSAAGFNSMAILQSRGWYIAYN